MEFGRVGGYCWSHHQSSRQVLVWVWTLIQISLVYTEVWTTTSTCVSLWAWQTGWPPLSTSWALGSSQSQSVQTSPQVEAQPRENHQKAQPQARDLFRIRRMRAAEANAFLNSKCQWLDSVEMAFKIRDQKYLFIYICQWNWNINFKCSMRMYI